MQPTDLEVSIFRTVCWFSVFEIPLTRFDVWKWLLLPNRSYDLFEVDRVIEHSEWLSSRLQEKNGKIFLRSAVVDKQLLESHHRFLDACRKFCKLRRAAHFFELIPGVQAVFAVNTLAWWHTTTQSDIDVFIVTSANHIWSSRLFVVFPFFLIGNRPGYSQSSQNIDPFCFSFFCTTDALKLEALKVNDEDYYFAYWIKSIVPIFDRAGVTDQLNRQNKWVDRMIPNSGHRFIHQTHKPFCLNAFPISFRFFQSLFRNLQRNRFPTALRDLANRDSRVVIHDQMLKFHQNDRREEFIQQFKKVYETHLG